MYKRIFKRWLTKKESFLKKEPLRKEINKNQRKKSGNKNSNFKMLLLWFLNIYSSMYVCAYLYVHTHTQFR